MFQRRAPLSMARKTRALIWPEMGWRRAWRYLCHRVGRLPGSGYAIAGGIAWGAAMSVTPFIGLHILLAAIASWITRCSIVAGVIGTVVGNPWTFPFIWIWLYKAGVAMGFGQEGVAAHEVDFSGLFGGMTEAALRGDWSFLGEQAWPVLMPMIVASIPTAAIVWVIFFLLLKPAIGRYKSSIAVRRAHRTVSAIKGLPREQEGTT